MNFNQIYKPPQNEGVDNVRPPFSIIACYVLVILFCAAGLTLAMLELSIDKSSLSDGIGYAAFQCALTLILGWLLFNPIRQRDARAYLTPTVLIVVVVAFELFDIMDNGSALNAAFYASVIESIVLATIIALLRTPAGRSWCNVP